MIKKDSKTTKLSKELYPNEVILKASHFFTDKYYITLDVDDKYYYISFEPIDGKMEKDVLKEFSNEVITQATRYKIMQETKNIRELILGRALASTIIDDSDSGFIDDENINADDILINWFEK